MGNIFIFNSCVDYRGGVLVSDMISFSIVMLEALADFLGTAPVFYLFALVCFCFIVKAFKILIS